MQVLSLLHRLPVPDLISQVIGDARRAENWTSPGLSQAVLDGRLKHQAVSVSRYYLMATPPVIVDFEPAPHVGKMFVEQKRVWCHAQGIVYVPIFLRERLTEQSFRERYDDERAALAASRKTRHEDAALASARRATKARGWTISDPEVQTLIDTETLARIQAEAAAGYALRGGAKMRRIERVRAEVEAEYLQRIRDGRVGHQLRYRQSA